MVPSLRHFTSLDGALSTAFSVVVPLRGPGPMKIVCIAFTFGNVGARLRSRLYMTPVGEPASTSLIVPTGVITAGNNCSVLCCVGFPSVQQTLKMSGGIPDALNEDFDCLANLAPLPNVLWMIDVAVTIEEEAGGVGAGSSISGVRMYVEDYPMPEIKA